MVIFFIILITINIMLSDLREEVYKTNLDLVKYGLGFLHGETSAVLTGQRG